MELYNILVDICLVEQVSVLDSTQEELELDNILADNSLVDKVSVLDNTQEELVLGNILEELLRVLELVNILEDSFLQ